MKTRDTHRPTGARAATRPALGLALASALAAAPAAARELAAHEHGAAALDVALDGTRLYVDLDTPADNVLGFEHAPASDTQRERVSEARRTLESGEIFVPDEAAGCALEDADVSIALAGGKEHDDGEHDDGGHGHGGGHDGDDGRTGATHSNITARYTFVCEEPQALRQVATTLFERFDGFVDIDVQLVGPGGQDAAELTPGRALITLDAIR